MKSLRALRSSLSALKRQIEVHEELMDMAEVDSIETNEVINRINKVDNDLYTPPHFDIPSNVINTSTGFAHALPMPKYIEEKPKRKYTKKKKAVLKKKPKTKKK